MTIKCTRYFGMQVRRDIGSNGNAYLWAVVWFPRSSKRLGYWYPSVRWF